uniref:Uncharacterized protein n=1 Tax=Cacopsylla melanoneura TaxID=428564 RepID=A0A8D9BAP8_9HEMI
MLLLTFKVLTSVLPTPEVCISYTPVLFILYGCIPKFTSYLPHRVFFMNPLTTPVAAAVASDPEGPSFPQGTSTGMLPYWIPTGCSFLTMGTKADVKPLVRALNATCPSG